MAELDRGEVEAGVEDGALSFSLSSVKLVKSQTGCSTMTLRYRYYMVPYTTSVNSRYYKNRSVVKTEGKR